LTCICPTWSMNYINVKTEIFPQSKKH